MEFKLEVPDVEQIKEEVKVELEPKQEDVTAISEVAQNNALQIMNVDVASLEDRRNITTVIDNFGSDVVQRSESKNAILGKRLVDVGGNEGETALVANNLEQLAIKMRDLDPSAVDFAKKGLLSKMTNPVRKYFEKYKSADQEISTIIQSLDKGKAALKADSTTLEIEEVAMRNITKDLGKNIELGTQLDSYLQQAIDNERAKGGDEDRIRFVEEEVLFPLRQRVMDFQQLQLVNQQGIIALEVIRRNNGELIRSVDRAKNVTVSSLRTAVTIAGALYNQKIVIDKIDILNQTTNTMIMSTSKMLKEQGVAVQRQATEANISPDTLKQAFSDAITALDDISEYKQQALPQMRKTIEEFKAIADEGERQIQRIESNIHS